MLECHACLRRYLRALLSFPRVPNASPSPRLIARGRFQSRSIQSEAAPAAARTNDSSLVNLKWWAQDGDAGLADPQEDPGSPPKTWSEAVGERQRRSFRATEAGRRVRHRQNHFIGRELKESNLRTELKYLKDPVKLADHIKYVLESDDEEKALALCRMSSKALANTVSWNYLLDWQMKKGKTNAAMSTYNEMKKRAQKPDSHTYVILLRGLANYAHYGNALGKALSIFHSMQAPNSPHAPNIIHVNAVLKVCARANDMDSLWDIASKLPERGAHSANSWTFTTILNYMRINVLAEIENDPGSDTSLRRVEEMVMKGKQLWTVILARWREGELTIDEDLVCSMGRLMLTGSRPRDWDNVLSLVEQTMNITRLEPRLGTVARQMSGAPKIRAPYTPKDLKDNPAEIQLKVGDESEDSLFDPMEIKPPRHVAKNHRNLPGRGLYAFAKPGNSTLSLVLESCLKTILKHAAKGYWDLFTDPNGHGIRPDLDNVHMLLRNLRRAGMSTEAMQLVEDLPRLNLPPTGQTFWLAMTACQRDFENPATVENGRRLLDCMQRTLAVPNVMTISIYLDLARRSNAPEAIMSALQRVWPSVINLRSLLSYGGAGEITDTPVKAATYRKEALRLFHAIISCYNFLLRPARNLELGSLRQTYQERRTSLEAFIKRQTATRASKSPDGEEASGTDAAGDDKTEQGNAPTAHQETGFRVIRMPL